MASQRSTIYEFVIDEAPYAFLDLESGPLNLGSHLARELANLNDRGINTFERNLRRNYIRDYTGEGSVRFDGDLLELSENPQQYRKVSSESDEYNNVDFYYTVNFDENLFEYNSRDRVIVESKTLRYVRTRPNEFIQHLENELQIYSPTSRIVSPISSRYSSPPLSRITSPIVIADTPLSSMVSSMASSRVASPIIERGGIQSKAIYGFQSDNRLFLFLQIGNAGPAQLGVRIVRDLARLTNEDFETIFQNLRDRYSEDFPERGITQYNGDFIRLSENPQAFRKIEIGSDEYERLSDVWSYIFDFVNDKLIVYNRSYRLRNDYGLKFIREELDVIIEDLEDPNYSIAHGQPIQQVTIPRGITNQRVQITLRDEENLLKNLDFDNVIIAHLPEDRVIDPVSLEPIEIYFLRCEQDPRTAHYFDATYYPNLCGAGPLSCAICPMDKRYNVSPQVYRVQENIPLRATVERVRTFEEIDQGIDGKYLYIDGLSYQVLGLKKESEELTLSAIDILSTQNITIKIRGEGRFEVEINNKISYSLVYLIEPSP